MIPEAQERSKVKVERPSKKTIDTYSRSLDSVVLPILQDFGRILKEDGPFSFEDLGNPLVYQALGDLLLGMPNTIMSKYGVSKAQLRDARSALNFYHRVLNRSGNLQDVRSRKISSKLLDHILESFQREEYSFEYRSRLVKAYQDVLRAYQDEPVESPEFWNSLKVLLYDGKHPLLEPLKDLPEPEMGGDWRGLRSSTYRTLAGKMASAMELVYSLQKKRLLR